MIITKDIPHDDNVYRKCAQEVFNRLGSGYQETVYQKALRREFQLQNIDHQDETVLPINYKGATIGYCRSDITILPDGPILELKAISSKPSDVQLQQIINYLKITEKNEGYLINFPQPSRLSAKNTREKIDIIRVRINCCDE